MSMQIKIDDIMRGRELEVQALAELLEMAVEEREAMQQSISGAINNRKMLHEVCRRHIKNLYSHL